MEGFRPYSFFCSLTALVFQISLDGTAGAVMFDWAVVGNPGNAPDPETGFGAVDYVYRISKHEVTNDQYAEFLNAVDPNGLNSLELYNSSMTTDPVGGIILEAHAADKKYRVKTGRGRNPVVYASFFDAMRFVNWLHNGQGDGGTESGVYSIGRGVDEVRDPAARYFIPTEDEWYKAAYHKNDGVTGNYWDYPTSTDVIPYSDNPLSLNTPDNTNVANFFKDDGIENGYDGGWAVTGITSRDPGLNYLTDVGAYSLAVSPYGTYDQGGSLWEWNELSDSLESRGLRGGDWGDLHFDLLSTLRNGFIPSTENSVYGFRIAGAIPEPQSVLLGFCFTCFIFAWGRSLTARRRSTGR